MSTPSQRRDRICVIWYCFGWSGLIWIVINHIFFSCVPSDSKVKYYVLALAGFAYLSSSLMLVFAYLVGSDMIKKTTIPAACSLAWGTINFIYGLFLFSPWDFSPFSPFRFVVSCIPFGFSMGYLYAGWIGLFHLTSSHDDPPDDTDPF